MGSLTWLVVVEGVYEVILCIEGLHKVLRLVVESIGKWILHLIVERGCCAVENG
jgi:hypothetical protein